MLSVQEFSSKIKAKYPEYKGVDDATLAQKMADKYPEYKSQVNLGGGQSSGSSQQVAPKSSNPFGAFGDAINSAGKAIGDTTAGLIGAVADTTIKPLAEGIAGVGAMGLASAKGSAGYASAFNPLDFHPEQAGERQQKGLTEPIEMFGKNYNPIRADEKGQVDIGETTRQAGGVLLKGTGGAINTASLGSPGIATKFVPQFVGGATTASGEALQQGDDLQTAGVKGAISGALQGTISKAVGAATKGLEKSALGYFLKPIDFTKKQKGVLGEDGLTILAKHIQAAKPNPLAGKAGIQKIVSQGRKLQGKKIDTLIKAANEMGEFQGTPIEKMSIDALERTFSPKGLAKIKASPDEMAQAALKVREVANFYLGKYADKPLDLIEQQALKTGIKAGKYEMGALDSAVNVYRQNLKDIAKTNIEKAIPEIGNVNQLYNLLREAGKRMAKSGKSSGYLTNVIAGSQGAGLAGTVKLASDLSQGKFDPVGTIAAAIAGGLIGPAAKKALNADLTSIFMGRANTISAETLKKIAPWASQKLTKVTTDVFNPVE